jgi:hypothetical protein
MVQANTGSMFRNQSDGWNRPTTPAVTATPDRYPQIRRSTTTPKMTSREAVLTGTPTSARCTVVGASSAGIETPRAALVSTSWRV